MILFTIRSMSEKAIYRQLHFSGIGKSSAFIDLLYSPHREGPSDGRRDVGRPRTKGFLTFWKDADPDILVLK